MAKKSKTRVTRFEKDRPGCMWSLISIFDFRQGRSSQKLLSDRKHGSSKRIGGATYPNIKLESLTDSCEICKETNDTVQSETSTVDPSKMSVKELMEEEMCGEQDQKKHGSTANGDPQQTLAANGGHAKKPHRRTRSKMSFDLGTNGFVAAGDLVSEKPSHRRHKSASSVDLNVMVEELCSRIHPKDTNISCLNNVRDGEIPITPLEDPPPVTEDKLGEAVKVLVNHFTDKKSLTKDGKVQPSKELVDSLQILNSNKEIFLKLLQDPNSQLVKHIQSLQDIQVEEGKFKVLTGTDLLDQDLGIEKQHNFWRRFKGLDRNSSKKSDAIEDLNRIVVLKPGPPSSRNLDTASSICSSSLPGSPRRMGEKGQIERPSSPFSFSEFKRKLKHAMRKEQHGVDNNGMSHQPSNEQLNLTNRDKRIGGESLGMASPSRDHFFIERVPKSFGRNHPTPEQRVSTIYIEAKKHLAEIVGNSDLDGDTPSSRQVPKSLGRILSYYGYSSPTICSPRKEGDIRLSLSTECRSSDEKTSQIAQESNVTHPMEVKREPESEPCKDADKPRHEAEVPTMEPRISVGPTHEHEFLASEVDEESVRSPDAESKKEIQQRDPSFEPCRSQTTTTSELVDNHSISSEENWHSTSLGQDSSDKNEPSSSEVASTLVSSATGKIEDLDVESDATSRPSPVSVLEPFFKEDDISPPGIKSLTAVQPIQPRQIHFEEVISVPSEQAPCHSTTTESDKYTVDFVKAVVQMSGLSWDELLRRSILSEHLIDPSLIDEVDFLPDLLSYDFNLLFDLINEVLIGISSTNFSSMLSFVKKPYVQPQLKGKDIFNEVWKGVDWYLKLEGPPHTLDQILSKDFAKAQNWMDLRPDCEIIGIHMQEIILEDLVEDTILSCVAEIPESCEV